MPNILIHTQRIRACWMRQTAAELAKRLEAALPEHDVFAIPSMARTGGYELSIWKFDPSGEPLRVGWAELVR